MEKKSKIGKLDMIYGSKIGSLLPSGINDIIILSQKVNEIIDYLNTLPKEEGSVVDEYVDIYGNTIVSQANIRFAEHQKIVEENKKKEDKFNKKFLLQDTPEEWEGNIREFLGEYSDLDGLIEYIKNLLLERERWAIDTFLKDTASYNSFHYGRPRTMRNGLSGEGFEVRVSKLNKKK